MSVFFPLLFVSFLSVPNMNSSSIDLGGLFDLRITPRPPPQYEVGAVHFWFIPMLVVVIRKARADYRKSLRSGYWKTRQPSPKLCVEAPFKTYLSNRANEVTQVS